MHFEQGEIYHVYNRGNAKQKIFFSKDNYIFFIKKVRTEWLTYTDILAYCLMPNHFHFMLLPNENGCSNIHLSQKETSLQQLSKKIGNTLSSYTRAINIQQQTSGILFQKKTKAKCITDSKLLLLANTIPGKSILKEDYLVTCFYYIHKNPVAAGFVNNFDEWEFSSAKDYMGLRNGTLCNKELFFKLSGITEADIKAKNFIPDTRLVSNLF